MRGQDFWKRYYKVYDNLLYLIPYQELLGSVCEELELQDGLKVLDVGCGSGNLAVELKKKMVDVTGLDFSAEALELLFQKDPKIKTVLYDFSKELPFSDGSFDRIVLNNVLYTIPRSIWDTVISELFRVLKNDGVIVLVNPQKNNKPIKIYQEGIKKNVIQKGIFSSLLLVTRLVVPTTKILFYNYLITKNTKYFFPEEGEQEEHLIKIGFSDVKIFSVYAGQSLLVKGFKK